MIDVITRLLPGSARRGGVATRIVFGRFIEWPQYTRPRVWRDRAVPDVLLSGHQANIDREREVSRLIETITKKPELLNGQSIDRTLWELLAKRLESDAPNDE